MSAVPPPLHEDRQVSAGHGYHRELRGTGGRETVCLLNGLAMSPKSRLGFLPELTPTCDRLHAVGVCYGGNTRSSRARATSSPLSGPTSSGRR